MKAILNHSIYYFVMLLATTSISAQSIQVEKRGTGTQHLVLIPCSGCDWRSWEVFMTENLERYTMHAITLPGLDGKAFELPHNDTQTPLFDFFVNEIARYIKNEIGENVAVLGHSMGGTVALKLSIEHPQLISGLILEDWGGVHPASLNIKQDERQAKAKERFDQLSQMTNIAYVNTYQPIYENLLPNAQRAAVYIDVLGRTDMQVMAQMSYEMRQIDLRQAQKKLNFPVLAIFGIYTGTEDVKARKKEVKKILKGIKKLDLHYVKDTNHWIHESHLAEFQSIVHRFLQ